ncbi:uncharacterized protein LOC124165700 [Ischnura elegans]|uniref:uncharacterized protein LOC124165700 n=1 Tax=Ischnura elegans TaxID=197161 RepID=UPI001ED896B0|nr:uncharacterized protein LOC124165700 [Ischnura elegans]
MPYVYIGRTTSFRGKSLWEIVGNLKNFGVGRMVVRSRFERYPEPSYMRIVKVEALENQPSRRVAVWVERVFRGRKDPEITKIMKTSYKTDYRLIPKDEEEEYVKGVKQEVQSTSTYSAKRVVPKEMPIPPLLLELSKAALKGKISPEKIPTTIPLIVKQGPANRAIVVENVKIEETILAEEPDVPRLYGGLK